MMILAAKILGLIVALFIGYHGIRFAYYWEKAKRGIPARIKSGPNAGKLVYVRHKIDKEFYTVADRPGGITKDIISSDNIIL